MTTFQASARIILPYFGSLPPHFDLWLESCARNSAYHWLVLTDDKRSFILPPNVVVLSMTLEELAKRIRERVGVCPVPLTPYKLCDFKVTYGHLFEEFLDGYPFWGFCDADLVFGDLEVLELAPRMKRDEGLQGQGHLAFYRNSPEARQFYRLQAPGIDYREIHQWVDPVAFDEWRGVPALLKHHDIPFSHSSRYADIIPGKPRFEMLHSSANTRHQVFAWEQGHIYGYHLRDGEVERKEYAYIHIQKRPMPRGTILPGNDFYITPRGYEPKEHPGPPNPVQVRHLARPVLQRLLHHTARSWTRWIRPSPYVHRKLPRLSANG